MASDVRCNLLKLDEHLRTRRRQSIATMLLPALCILGTACRPAPELGELSSEDLAGIRDLREAFVHAELRGDRTAQAALFTEDAVLMEPGAPLREGRTVIEEGLREFDVTLEDFGMSSIEVEGGAGFAYDRGTYSLRWRTFGTGDMEEESGDYLMVVRKTSGGTWRIAALLHNRGA